jgi:Ca2+-binding EF-hand superfamily protein
MTQLFSEIDQDKSGGVDIDEFIYFISKNQSGMSAKASTAVLNIKGARRISLHDLRDIFN